MTAVLIIQYVIIIDMLEQLACYYWTRQIACSFTLFLVINYMMGNIILLFVVRKLLATLKYKVLLQGEFHVLLIALHTDCHNLFYLVGSSKMMLAVHM